MGGHVEVWVSRRAWRPAGPGSPCRVSHLPDLSRLTASASVSHGPNGSDSASHQGCRKD